MDLKKEALAWVNRTRGELSIGEPLEALPTGIRNACSDCVIARGLDSMFDLSYGTVYDGEDEVLSIPPYVVDFMEEFDRGLHPELDEACH